MSGERTIAALRDAIDVARPTAPAPGAPIDFLGLRLRVVRSGPVLEAAPRDPTAEAPPPGTVMRTPWGPVRIVAAPNDRENGA